MKDVPCDDKVVVMRVDVEKRLPNPIHRLRRD